MGTSSTRVEKAVAILRRGGLVAFPTETVYGLGADAMNADAVRHLFAVKGRPRAHPVIAHLGAHARLDDWALDATDAARDLTRACWPGALTVVVRRRPNTIVDEVTGGRETVGLRVPDHPVALALLDAFGGAIAAPSANRFGRVSPTTAAHVRDDLAGDVDLVLDGGPSTVGVESTIVDCTTAQLAILRVGGIPIERIEAIVGHPVGRSTSGEVAAPGTLASHYAPRARVEVVAATDLDPRAAALTRGGYRVGVLTLAAIATPDAPVTRLDPPHDDEEYARVLYQRLREADACALDVVLAVPPPDRGIGTAVRDRLQRAAYRYR